MIILSTCLTMSKKIYFTVTRNLIKTKIKLFCSNYKLYKKYWKKLSISFWLIFHYWFMSNFLTIIQTTLLCQLLLDFSFLNFDFSRQHSILLSRHCCMCFLWFYFCNHHHYRKNGLCVACYMYTSTNRIQAA